MATLCRPATAFPSHVLTTDEALAFARRQYPDVPHLTFAERLIRGTQVHKRHLVQPVERIADHAGLEARNAAYEEEAKKLLPGVIGEALDNAGLRAPDIDATVFVSCTGFLMPSLTSWMINALGFRTDMRQFPIAQLGCAAGGAAVGLAHDYCLAHPDANVLVVSCEFCSLTYQPTDTQVGSLVSAGLFGDAAAAVVVRGDDRGTGAHLRLSGSHVIPGTADWISYTVKATGFHFNLDKRVPSVIGRDLCPAIEEFAARDGWKVGELDFYVLHAGGPRIVQGFAEYFGVDERKFENSMDTVREYGNIASAVVLEALRRTFDDPPQSGAAGLIAGFGPGITGQFTFAVWAGGDAR
ncbi:type III polyketide synthase [Streptomyces sp. NPDC059627]